MRYDVVVIGSGFGGSVAALRAAEKGYAVAVLEAGRRFADHEFPETSWRAGRFLWAPALGWYGIQRITRLPGRRGAGVLVLSGAGVGGGSLVYANTLYRPLPDFYTDPQWRKITDWAGELAPWYDLASRMLGVTSYPRHTPADAAIRAVAERMGAGRTFQPTPVAVHFGPPGETVDDPYFGGAGPPRSGCLHCGSCMTGCRHNAKNTLVKNYLWLAERAGAVVEPRTTVTAVRPAPGGGYAVETVRTGARLRQHRRTFHAAAVVFAAGALGTQRLLHAMRAAGALPHLSDRLGSLTRTNSEAILGASVPARAARRRGLDFSQGVAITSSFHPEPRTRIEPVRYGPGSNAMGILQSVLAPPAGRGRAIRWLGRLLAAPRTSLRMLWLRGWSQRTIVALVMQSLDNSVTVRWRRAWYGRRRLAAVPGHGAPNPTWIPDGHRAARLLAEEIGGIPGGSITEPFNVPMTAHILGGAVIGATPAEGVVDPYQRVFGHPGLHVLDGAAVSANPGVNPALTITAQAERAMALWPNRGDPDPRPPLGAPYQRLSPVPPRHPAVAGPVDEC